MAIFKGDNITKMDAVPAVNVDSTYAGGRLRVFYDEYDFDATPAGSNVNIARLPIGAVVYDFLMMHDILSATGFLSMGDADDLTRYMLNKSVSAADTKSMTDDGNDGGFSGFKITKETQDILLTVSSAAFSGSLKCSITYALD